jgi:putative PIN family toxin of toxin-antitoxin system
MKIVSDTNVLISGILFGGHPRRILMLASRGLVTNFTSPALLREAEEVLKRPKFGLSPAQVSNILSLFRDTFELVEPTRRINAVPDDPDDNAVIETAAEASADAIVSGDRHLLTLQAWKRIPILSPAAFIKLQEARHNS